ncbi:MAG: PSD1 and planctomycete cytochrome C domain-containing protein [Planctomycetaceae bacterium]|jgi:hypothetical protein
MTFPFASRSRQSLKSRWHWRLLWLVPLVGPLVQASAVRGADEVQFGRDILPILSAHCFACHGPDAQARKADLRLDVAEGALAQRDSGPALTAGSLDQSEVWQRIISTDESLVMPPPSTKKPLTDGQKELLKKWIEQGAKYQRHWSFTPPVKPEVPAVEKAGWQQNPIDRFLLARMREKGLEPRPEASKPTLIRRVAFALTGLPPTPAEVEAFEADTTPQAYENMVNRYLASPRYGEEMARHWLDVARYADTHGLHLDNLREMWAYRDWVVGAFNRNLPFDQFTIEQLAGDKLPNPTREQLIATGFNRCNVTTSEGGSIDAEFLFRYAVDRTATTLQAWMGLTGGCAVCHDHKYDPLTQREFYSLYSFFYSAADPAMDRNINTTDPFLRLPNPEQEQDLAALRQAEQQARQAFDEWLAKQDPADPASQPPAAVPVAVEDVWFDDEFPLNARLSCSSRNASTWSVAPRTPVVSGLRALRQAFASSYTDKAENFGVPVTVPAKARFSIFVRIDPKEPPQTLMLELNTTKGVRRALWGNAEKMGGGAVGSPERLRVGDIPTDGAWNRLEVTGEQWQLTGGEAVRGITLGQFGGVVDWDRLAVAGELAPEADPRASFVAWWKDRTGVDTPGIPADLAAPLKEGPEKEVAPEIKARLRQYFLQTAARPASADWRQARARLDLARAQRLVLEESLPGTFIFKDLDQPRDAFVMTRGQYDKPGEKVTPAVPAIFPPLKLDDPNRRPNRLDLARWLMAEENPLPARVTVNRLWQQFFGTGLVKTSDDFGAQGEPPSHPELLDWLAVQYRELGWNTKEFVKQMLLSSAFRQDARVAPEVLAKDPENRLYARGPRFRLDAEQIRDNALFVSGLINLKMGGPGVRPYQPPNIWEPVGYADSNTRFYLQDHGEDLYRRSLYCFLKRTAPPPFMSNFDGPNREQLCARRERTNTPLQALQLMNDTQQFEAARVFAERILEEGGSSTEDRLRFALRTVLARTPAAEELTLLTRAVDHYRERYAADPQGARQVIHVGEAAVRSEASPTDLAAWTLVANLILNLDETVTRN